MLKRIRNHSLGRNALALTAMQAANYIAPLAVVPYLTRTLGVNAFGAVAVTLAAIQFACVITDFGFALSATRDIALNNGDKGYISRKIGAVYGAKLPLFLLSAVALVMLPAYVEKFAAYEPLFRVAVIAVFAMTFQPVWFFLGIERMKNVTIYSVATKFLYVTLVFAFVHSPADAVLVIACWGGAQLVGMFVSSYMVFREGYSIRWPSFNECVQELHTSAQFFWSRLAVAAYTSANTIVMGTVGVTQSAHYAVCERVFNAGKSVSSPITTALFPYMTKRKDWRLFVKLVVIVGSTLAVGCAVVALFAGPLLGFVFGPEYASSAPVLAVFCAVVVINYLGVTFGYSAFSALNKVHIANISVIAGMAMQVTIVSWLYVTGRADPQTMALSVLVTETFVMCFRMVFVFSLTRRAGSLGSGVVVAKANPTRKSQEAV